MGFLDKLAAPSNNIQLCAVKDPLDAPWSNRVSVAQWLSSLPNSDGIKSERYSSHVSAVDARKQNRAMPAYMSILGPPDPEARDHRTG